MTIQLTEQEQGVLNGLLHREIRDVENRLHRIQSHQVPEHTDSTGSKVYAEELKTLREKHKELSGVLTKFNEHIN